MADTGKAVDSVYLHGTDAAYNAQERLSKAIGLRHSIVARESEAVYGNPVIHKDLRAAYSAL